MMNSQDQEKLQGQESLEEAQQVRMDRISHLAQTDH